MKASRGNGGNPFYGISIGFTVQESDGSFSASVFNDGLSKFAQGTEGTIRMSGNSAFIYTDSMNQGSFGVSGSYGAKGVAQYSAAVSGYVGNTSAQNSRSTSLSIDLMTWAGIEYINFNELSVTELVSGMSKNPRTDLLTALEKFNSMRSAGAAAGDQAVTDWIIACENFYQRWGTGVVVGVLWGGYGSVKLTFTSEAQEDKWQYGGDANFTYAGTGASVAISAAYGGSKSSIAETGSAEVSAYYSGKNVQNEITEWAKQYQAIASKGLAELGKQKVTRNADLSDPSGAPSVPDFVKPKSKSKVTDLVKEIKDLDGLEAYATAAAFEKYKAAGGQDDLDNFIKERATENDISGLPNEPVAPNIDENLQQPNVMTRRKPDSPMLKKSKVAKALAATAQEDFVPMGLWIASWSKLFPWLVSGHDNRIPKDAQATDIIRLRTFIQDCRSLERIYHTVHTADASMDGVDFVALRDAFAHASANATEIMRTMNRNEAGDQVHRLVNNLSTTAQTIYRVWVDNPILREYQLAGGLFATNEVREGIGDKILGSLRDVSFSPSGDVKGVMHFKPSSFELDKEPANTEAFAQDVKGRPVILPDGSIVIFIVNEDVSSSGFLCGNIDEVNTFDIILKHSKKISHFEWENFLSAIPFTIFSKGLKAYGRVPEPWPGKKDTLLGKPGIYVLTPIPFSAAKGVDWRFGAVTTGTGDLQSQLDDLRKKLKARPQWSLDSDHWTDTTWSDNMYSIRTIKPSYIGITEEVTNIFGSR